MCRRSGAGVKFTVVLVTSALGRPKKMLEEDFEKTIKVLIVGNGKVGKSSMIRRFCTGTFTNTYKRTIGVDFLEKVQYCRDLGEDVRMMLWDTAGQEEYDTITRTYYRGAGACVLAFSTTDRDSFNAVTTWKKKVEAECGEIAMVLVQTKVDLIDQAVVDKDEAEQLAENLGLKFYRTSVKDNLNVDLVFEDLVSLADQYAQSQDQRRSASQSQAAIGGESGSSSDRGGGSDNLQGDEDAPPMVKKKSIFKTKRDSKDESAAASGESFTISGPGPSKQRSGGKKKKFKNCSIG